MSDRRIDDLFEYLSGLTKLQDIGVRCHKEIDECISEIRRELGLDKDAIIELDGEAIADAVEPELRKRELVRKRFMD